MKTLAQFMFAKRKTPHDKYKILAEYFGTAGIFMESYAQNKKANVKKQYHDAIKNGHVYHPDDCDGIRNVISIIEKPFEKRTEKDKEILYRLLCELNFFKFRKPMNREELMVMTNHLGYTCVESGKNLFKQGDYADKFYICLKGCV